ncbi:MAG: hypothetical protein ACMXYG_07435 [Candidatus Woesearchaeota archaeon]
MKQEKNFEEELETMFEELSGNTSNERKRTIRLTKGNKDLDEINRDIQKRKKTNSLSSIIQRTVNKYKTELCYIGETIGLGLFHYYIIDKVPSMKFFLVNEEIPQGYEELAFGAKFLAPFFLSIYTTIHSGLMTYTGTVLEPEKERHYSGIFLNAFVTTFFASAMGEMLGGNEGYVIATSVSGYVMTRICDKSKAAYDLVDAILTAGDKK